MLIASLVLVGLIVGVSLIAGAIVAIFRSVTKSATIAVAAGTLLLPLLLCAALAYWILTMEVDDPAPGNVLIGTAIFLAAITPTAFFASRVTNHLLTRRASRSGH